MHAIETQQLCKSFGEVAVLRGVDLAVAPGEVFGLLGQNGAGKTTLVRILATLLPPDAGNASVLGRDVVRHRGDVRGSIGLTGQFASVDDLLTGEENLIMLGRLLHLDRYWTRRRSRELLERFDLVEAAQRRVQTYSGGMRRRLDLAASLMAAPPVVFLDEPTTGLDPRSRRRMWDVVADMAAEGTTVLLTTQYLEEADRLADRIAVLHGGTIVTEGTASALKREVGSQRAVLTVDPRDLEAAQAALAPTASLVDATTSAITIPLQDADELRTHLNRLADSAVTIADVQVATPTLDDVFFTMTAPRTEGAR